MDNYILTCCSTVDIPHAILKKRNIPFALFRYSIDGIEYYDDQSVSAADFYALIREGAQPVTSQIPSTDYEKLWEPLLKEGKDILHVSLSGGITGTANSALLAANHLLKHYEGRRIEIVDSLCASVGYGLLIMEMADRRDEGYSLDQLKAWAEEYRYNVHHWFFSSDLTSFKRGGRISASAAFFGTVLGICPLITIDEEGHLVPQEKVKGRKMAIKHTCDKMLANAVNEGDYDGRCLICHSDCREDAERLRKMLEEHFPFQQDKIDIVDIGAVIGAHTGPGTVGLVFTGKKRETHKGDQL